LTTQIVENRNEGLKVGYEATDWSNKISFDDYVKSLENWTVKTIEKNGQPIGAVYLKNDELHVSVKPEWRRKWLTKNLYLELFVGKKVTTRVTKGHDYMYDILRRLNFRDDGTGLMVKE
jgi:hypothetical protein